jgi:hypothetical protein
VGDVVVHELDNRGGSREEDDFEKLAMRGEKLGLIRVRNGAGVVRAESGAAPKAAVAAVAVPVGGEDQGGLVVFVMTVDKA